MCNQLLPFLVIKFEKHFISSMHEQLPWRLTFLNLCKFDQYQQTQSVDQ